MAVVWRAWDPKLEREVAIKEPLTTGMAGVAAADLAARFVREGQAAARLSHPNIVSVYAADVYDGRPALVMELIEGRPLSRMTGGPLPAAEVMTILDQLLYAIGYAHSKGIVHRDIKPDNVFVDDDDRLKLADFGIAHVGKSAALTQAGTMLGTPGYMAPEQVTGAPADERSDLFASAVMGYEMLAGRNPFGTTGRDETTAVLYRIVHQEAEPIERVVPNVPPGLAAVITRGMAKDPAMRFQSATEMRAALRSEQPTHHAQAPAVTAYAGQPQQQPVQQQQQQQQAYGAGVAPQPAKRAGRAPVIIGVVALILLVWLGACCFISSIGGDSTSPTVAITQPPSGATPEAGTEIPISVDASDDTKVTSVRVLADGAVIATLSAPPFKTTYTPEEAGTHRIGAIAFDEAGNKAAAEVEVDVKEPSGAGAAKAVGAFWAAWDAKNMESAWNMMSSGYKKSSGGLEPFSNIFGELDGATVEYANSRAVVNGRATIDVKVWIMPTDVGAATPYVGSMELIRENGKWRIDTMNLKPI
jgi:hypothetical protein